MDDGPAKMIAVVVLPIIVIVPLFLLGVYHAIRLDGLRRVLRRAVLAAVAGAVVQVAAVFTLIASPGFYHYEGATGQALEVAFWVLAAFLAVYFTGLALGGIGGWIAGFEERIPEMPNKCMQPTDCPSGSGDREGS